MESLGSLILNNTYRDSVFLMKISSKVAKLEHIIEASAMMGTERNKDLFVKSGLSSEKVAGAKPDDLVIAIKAENEEALTNAIKMAEEMLSETLSGGEESDKQHKIQRLEQALAKQKDANVLMLSVAGDYAKYEAAKGLANGMNIMLYSDNISVEDELALKKEAHRKGLLVMGPDCGTSIINETPLAFANKIRKGCIGVVGASGTGIQETTSLIHRYGGGISQAIGTGGRDPKEIINGITMMDALALLADDPETKVILIVSKPPCASVEKKIADFVRSTKKPVVVNFAGETDYSVIQEANGSGCFSLEEAAFTALRLAGYPAVQPAKFAGIDMEALLANIQQLKAEQKYLRGIYSGGSLCYEAMHMACQTLKTDLYSNTPMHGMSQLANVRVSEKHTFLDMGEDEFTVGKPHPMIDPTEKAIRLTKEIALPEVAVVLTDCVIGFGSNENPAEALAVAAKEGWQKSGQKTIVIASVCGTEEDTQGYSKQVKLLTDAGIYVAQSNDQAAKLSLFVMEQLQKEAN